MTLGTLKQICENHNIPDDAVLMSDSGWECCETDMDGVYYNEKTNILMFTQETSKYEEYFNDPDWKTISEIKDETPTISDEDWAKAVKGLDNLILAYSGIGMSGMFGLSIMSQLKTRYENGERTQELYDSIMSCE